LIQNRSLRIVNNTGFHSHTDVLFLRNKVLKVDDLKYFNFGNLTYHLNTDMLPHDMESLLIINNQIHSYPTRQSEKPHSPFTTTVFSQKSLLFTKPKFWNDLDTSLKQVRGIGILKSELKYHLFAPYSPFNHIH